MNEMEEKAGLRRKKIIAVRNCSRSRLDFFLIAGK